MLTLQDYLSVITLFEERNISRAADRLDVTQPAVTSRLRRIETAIGAKLFERGRNGAIPTAAGTAFVEVARRVMETAAEAAEAARGAARGVGEVLRVGVTQIAARDEAINCLRKLREVAPELRLRLSEAPTAILEQRLAERQIDAAFLHPPLYAGGLTTLPLGERPLERVTYCSTGKDAGEIGYPRGDAPMFTSALERLDMIGGGSESVMAEADTVLGAALLSRAGFGSFIRPAGLETFADQVPESRQILADAPMLETCLAWRTLNRKPGLRALITCATEVARSPKSPS
ncbi:MAG: LysR family transcriptional regulator [Pseudomonadota bacterium]